MKALLTFIFVLALAWVPIAAETNALPPEEAAKLLAIEREMLHQHVCSGLTNAAWHLQRSNLLVITVNRSEWLSYRYCVKENGNEQDYTDTSTAAQDSRWKTLSEDELKKLRGALAELPNECAAPPWERTILVGFRIGTNWLGRIYDYNHQPAALRKIHEIIGERRKWEETK